MERCEAQADELLKRHSFVVETGDRGKLVWAVAAMMQRASLRLAVAARGEPIDGD